MVSCGKVALVYGSVRPVDAILWREPVGEWDSGFGVLFSDAPEHGDELEENDPRVQPVCLHCLVDEWPELGRGLDLARELGEVGYDADADEWFHYPELA